jgi:starch synthase
MRTEYKNDSAVNDIPVVFLIHNLRNQGMFDVHFVKDADYDYGTTPVPGVLGKNLHKLNGMRRGIMYADIMSTVSPTYAREILTPEFGERLEDVLKSRRSRLTGILNGIDQKKYNPMRDRVIRNNYSKGRLEGRQRNKLSLQRMFHLPQNPDIFTIGFVGRLDEQKGINLFSAIAPALFENIPFQFFLVGTGEKDYRMFFKELAEKYPDRVGVHLFFDEKLPKHIFAGADALIMPSRFEPAGLVQMEAMRYGCIPIVRNTGGLADTVTDAIPTSRSGTGFVFNAFEPMALLIAIVRAYTAYRDPRRWRAIVQRAMSCDFSWDVSAERHVELCRRAVATRTS